MQKPPPQSHLNLLEEYVEAKMSVDTTPERATAIAHMKEFGLPEFIELTGINAGDYGVYRIAGSGVTLRFSAAETDPDLPPNAKVSLAALEKRLSLQFPCTPEQFYDWHEATRSTNGVSDFTLAEGFLETLLATGTLSPAHLGKVRSSAQIIAAFRMDPDDHKNQQWWDARMRNAKRYGLKDARASTGRAKLQSQWNPTLVAAWLIDNGHLDRTAVLRAMQKHFPDVETDLLP